VQINLNADTNCEITYYTSNDKVLIENNTYSYTANSNYFNSINSTSRYVYFTVRNITNTNQTSLNFSVLYKDYPVSSGGSGGDVNIINPLNQDGSVFVGGNLNLTGNVNANITNTSLNVDVTNFPATQPVSLNQVVETTIQNPSIAITGSVDVNNFPTNQDVNITNSSVPISGAVDANITNTTAIPIAGAVDVNNFPSTQTVNGSVDANITNTSLNVSVANFPSSQDVNITNTSVPVSGSVDANITNTTAIPIAGAVDINNFPTNQDVNITNTSVPVSGSVSVSNFPSTQTVNGSVDANITNTSLNVSVANFPSSQDVNITNTSVPVSGSVDANITNTSLNVSVGNFPLSQDVNITNTSVPVSGAVDANITNTTAIPIAGAVDVNNFPTNQDVNITNTSVPVSGSVDANITNTSLNVSVGNFPATQDVNITNTSVPVSNTNLDNLQFDTQNNLKVIVENAQIHTYVDNLPATQNVNITNSYIDVGNFPATQNVNLSNITTNATLNVSDSSTHSYLSTAVSDLNKFTFDGANNLEVNINSLNSAFVDNNSLRVQVENTSVAITNSALSNMSFNTGSLNVKDTNCSYTAGALNVSDATTHTTLSNIYTCVNTRGSGIFIQGSIVAGGYTSVINLSAIPVKCLTIYGVCSDDTTLTVLFSQNGSNFYPSQYSYNISTSITGYFGFALNACPKYICLQTTNAITTLQAYLDYS
jgi:hypothetical protein